MDKNSLGRFVEAAWSYQPDRKSAIVKTLEDYIAIPNVSPAFAPDWAEQGDTDRAVELFAERLKAMQNEWSAAGVRTDDVKVAILGGRKKPLLDAAGERRTPALRVDIPAFGGAAAAGKTVLLYGHLDKQPGLEGMWAEGLGPTEPVIRDGKLYGRGGADDGYALWCAFSAVMAVRAAGGRHARAVILIEGAEESGRDDVEYYIQEMAAGLGEVGLVVCLDSGCGDYANLWTTGSLRGVTSGRLRVEVLREGVHSGDASGVVPSPFRILRKLLARLENVDNGEVFAPELRVAVPAKVRAYLARSAAVLGEGVWRGFPFVDGVAPAGREPLEISLARGWRCGMVVKGLDGFPPVAGSGNVMLPWAEAGLSMRLPPTLDAGAAAAFIKRELERDPPYGAKVSYTAEGASNGWLAPEEPAWLEAALRDGAREGFAGEVLVNAEGGSVPFMNFLAGLFPRAVFWVTGILGPGSNAHGPNECLDLPAVRRLTLALAGVLSAEAQGTRIG